MTKRNSIKSKNSNKNVININIDTKRKSRKNKRHQTSSRNSQPIMISNNIQPQRSQYPQMMPQHNEIHPSYFHRNRSQESPDLMSQITKEENKIKENNFYRNIINDSSHLHRIHVPTQLHKVLQNEDIPENNAGISNVEKMKFKSNHQEYDYPTPPIINETHINNMIPSNKNSYTQLGNNNIPNEEPIEKYKINNTNRHNPHDTPLIAIIPEKKSLYKQQIEDLEMSIYNLRTPPRHNIARRTAPMFRTPINNNIPILSPQSNSKSYSIDIDNTMDTGPILNLHSVEHNQQGLDTTLGSFYNLHNRTVSTTPRKKLSNSIPNTPDRLQPFQEEINKEPNILNEMDSNPDNQQIHKVKTDYNKNYKIIYEHTKEQWKLNNPGEKFPLTQEQGRGKTASQLVDLISQVDKEKHNEQINLLKVATERKKLESSIRRQELEIRRKELQVKQASKSLVPSLVQLKTPLKSKIPYK